MATRFASSKDKSELAESTDEESETEESRIGTHRRDITYVAAVNRGYRIRRRNCLSECSSG